MWCHDSWARASQTVTSPAGTAMCGLAVAWRADKFHRLVWPFPIVVEIAIAAETGPGGWLAGWQVAVRIAAVSRTRDDKVQQVRLCSLRKSESLWFPKVLSSTDLRWSTEIRSCFNFPPLVASADYFLLLYLMTRHDKLTTTTRLLWPTWYVPGSFRLISQIYRTFNFFSQNQLRQINKGSSLTRTW